MWSFLKFALILGLCVCSALADPKKASSSKSKTDIQTKDDSSDTKVSSHPTLVPIKAGKLHTRRRKLKGTRRISNKKHLSRYQMIEPTADNDNRRFTGRRGDQNGGPALFQLQESNPSSQTPNRVYSINVVEENSGQVSATTESPLPSSEELGRNVVTQFLMQLPLTLLQQFSGAAALQANAPGSVISNAAGQVPATVITNTANPTTATTTSTSSTTNAVSSNLPAFGFYANIPSPGQVLANSLVRPLASFLTNPFNIAIGTTPLQTTQQQTTQQQTTVPQTTVTWPSGFPASATLTANPGTGATTTIQASTNIPSLPNLPIPQIPSFSPTTGYTNTGYALGSSFPFSALTNQGYSLGSTLPLSPAALAVRPTLYGASPYLNPYLYPSLLQQLQLASFRNPGEYTTTTTTTTPAPTTTTTTTPPPTRPYSWWLPFQGMFPGGPGGGGSGAHWQLVMDAPPSAKDAKSTSSQVRSLKPSYGTGRRGSKAMDIEEIDVPFEDATMLEPDMNVMMQENLSAMEQADFNTTENPEVLMTMKQEESTVSEESRDAKNPVMNKQ